MKTYFADRGVQAALSAGVVIAAMAAMTDQYRAAYATLGLAWTVTLAVAVSLAHRKRAR